MNDLTPEEAKASLGISTRLSEQLLMQMNPPMEEEGSEMGETAPEPTEQPEVEETPEVDVDSRIDQKTEVLRAELKEMIRQEVGSIRQDIKDALANEAD